MNALLDGTLPRGETWHRDLLQQMVEGRPDVRPAVLSQDSLEALGQAEGRGE